MAKPQALTITLLIALAFPAYACQEILVSYPAVINTADLIFEATVVSSESDQRRTPNRMDPARILHLKVTKIVKGEVGNSISIPTVSCYVPGYDNGAQVTVVRFSKGEYHVVPRPQRT